MSKFKLSDLTTLDADQVNALDTFYLAMKARSSALTTKAIQPEKQLTAATAVCTLSKAYLESITTAPPLVRRSVREFQFACPDPYEIAHRKLVGEWYPEGRNPYAEMERQGIVPERKGLMIVVKDEYRDLRSFFRTEGKEYHPEEKLFAPKPVPVLNHKFPTRHFDVAETERLPYPPDLEDTAPYALPCEVMPYNQTPATRVGDKLMEAITMSVPNIAPVRILMLGAGKGKMTARLVQEFGPVVTEVDVQKREGSIACDLLTGTPYDFSTGTPQPVLAPDNHKVTDCHRSCSLCLPVAGSFPLVISDMAPTKEPGMGPDAWARASMPLIVAGMYSGLTNVTAGGTVIVKIPSVADLSLAPLLAAVGSLCESPGMVRAASSWYMNGEHFLVLVGIRPWTHVDKVTTFRTMSAYLHREETGVRKALQFTVGAEEGETEAGLVWLMDRQCSRLHKTLVFLHKLRAQPRYTVPPGAPTLFLSSKTLTRTAADSVPDFLGAALKRSPQQSCEQIQKMLDAYVAALNLPVPPRLALAHKTPHLLRTGPPVTEVDSLKTGPMGTALVHTGAGRAWTVRQKPDAFEAVALRRLALKPGWWHTPSQVWAGTGCEAGTTRDLALPRAFEDGLCYALKDKGSTLYMWDEQLPHVDTTCSFIQAPKPTRRAGNS